MKLRLIKAREIAKNVKATVHKSGRLGFTIQAAEKMDLDEYKFLQISVNDEDINDTSLYVKVLDEEEEDAFKVNKAGKYYYINLKAFFDELDIDYVNETIIYDIISIEIDGEDYFKFRRRPQKKIKKPPIEGV